MSVRSSKSHHNASMFTAVTFAFMAPVLHAAGENVVTASDASAPVIFDEVVVTGTRQVGLAASESPSPIMVLGSAELQASGKPDLVQALAAIVPSFTAQAFGGDMANQTLQAKLRGLSPNHALVLIDGKRRHTTANLAVLGGPYQGGAGADLNFIPLSAVDHVEVLTEGAAAQYGTDAIAGVINIILKKGASGGALEATYGGYFDGGGTTDAVSGNIGLEPYVGSYLNLTGEVRNHGHSERGGIDPRVVDSSNLSSYPNSNMIYGDDYPYLNKIQGDAEYHQKITSFNAGFDLGGGAELYSFGTYGYKEAESFENYRLPNRVSYDDPNTGATTYLYPYGFNPQEAIKETDYAITAGAKGAVAEWNWDIGSTYGDDHLKLYTLDSANASLYADTGATPTNFYDGAFISTQWTTNLDINKDFEVGLAGPLNLAFGAEYRRETYEIGSGDAASRYLEGGQSFPGFALTDAGKHERKNYAGYVDLAATPIAGLRLDAAIRYEHFSDFGDTTVGKLTGRYDFSSAFALRGTVSTGFRAPTLAEEYYSATNVGPDTAFVQLPPNAASAKLLGLGDGLKPEKSTNFSVGIVFHPIPAITTTLDVYQIEIRDRIVGSGTLYGSGGSIDSPAVTAAIAANGNVLDPLVTQTGVNIFTNGINTRTRGADLIVNYPVDYSWATIDWSIGATYNSTAVTKIKATPIELNGQPLFDATAISDLETASPKYVVNLGALITLGKVSANLREAVYGPSSEMQTYDGGAYYRTKIDVTPITNLELGYQATAGLKISIGATNLFNQYPNQTNSDLLAVYRAHNSNSAVGIYPSFSPFGINGGYYYAKATYKF
jgi:iron complex outermembrane receptor protein